MRARLEGPPRHVAMGLLREERGDGAVRAHAAAVSSAGPGATAKTIRMHNKRTSGAASPTAGRSLAAVSLYKVKEEGTQRGGSSSTMCETDDSRSPPTAESRTANLFTKAGRERNVRALRDCLSDGDVSPSTTAGGCAVWCLCFTTEAISRTGMIDDCQARRARLPPDADRPRVV